jgi:Mannosyl-glycoprotein endo-beta-N-acetylglucosaminidase
MRSRPDQSPSVAPPVAADPLQAFIDQVAPGALAAQRKYGVPAAVTIAQAIEESGWGQSGLASRDHNLFGIKGTGPAGSDLLPTQEYQNGQMVNRTAIFRVYHDFAESIDDHGKLLATSGYYRQSMADRLNPDKFAASLTGIYATDPEYGAKLIGLMRQYNLYRYGAARPGVAPGAAARGGASIPGLVPHAAPAPPHEVRPVRPLHRVRSVRPSPHVRPTRIPQPSRPARTPEPIQPAPTPVPVPPIPTPEPFRSAPAPQPAPSRHPTPPPGTPSAPSRPRSNAVQQAQLVSDIRVPSPGSRPVASGAYRLASTPGSRYRHHLPLPVSNAFLATAKRPIMYAEPLYRDVASHSGMRWELLAACDWMQCKARPRYSPVHGEKLGTLNPDGTIYHTKSEALEQCAEDLIDLARAVYGIDLTARAHLSVLDLANVFAAFRWGGLLKMHRTSAMEFPYSVAGLTDRHINMRWPNIDDPNAPDKPGARFHRPFGAVPVVLGLNYPAVA